MPQEIDLKQILDDAGGYKVDAYRFIRDGLAHTVRMVHGVEPGEVEEEDDSRHVSGQQLCLGLRDYATERWGKLARLVLGQWNIRCTEDFGRIIFAMVDAGLMRKTDEDTIDDFDEVFDFDEAFELPARSAGPVVQTPRSGSGRPAEAESPTAA